METKEIIKNPIFFILAVVLIILTFFYRKIRLKETSEKGGKIGAYALGTIPLKQDFYDYLNRKYLIHWVILAFVFFTPFVAAVYWLITRSIGLWKALPLLLFPLIFVAAFVQGFVYKKAKEGNQDTTGLGTTFGLVNYLTRKKALSANSMINLDLIGTVLVIIILSALFLWANLGG